MREEDGGNGQRLAVSTGYATFRAARGNETPTHYHLAAHRLREQSYHTDPVEGEIDVVRCLMDQAGMLFCGIAATQEICPIRRLASQLTMQSRKPSPALRRVRHFRKYRQIENRKRQHMPKCLF